MTVKELIQHLGEYDPDLMVVVDGYEGGYSEINFMTIRLELNANKEIHYYGIHEKTRDTNGVLALVLAR